LFEESCWQALRGRNNRCLRREGRSAFIKFGVWENSLPFKKAFFAGKFQAHVFLWSVAGLLLALLSRLKENEAISP
jgi:hypothetical protein